MLKPISIDETRRHLMLPQAIINRAVDEIAKSLRVDVVHDSDDLDFFEGVFVLLNGVPVALKHYRGHPSDTVTVYMPSDVMLLSDIGGLVRAILAELDLSTRDLRWQRSDWEDHH